jgi:trigger factor
MNVVELESSKGLNRVYEITIPAAEMDKRLAAKIEEIRPRVTLKGFRPGKVPTAHIKKMFGASIMQDVVQDVTTETSAKALEDKGVRQASAPHIHPEGDMDAVLKGGTDYVYHIHLDVMPDFQPADPKTLKITRPTAEVGDEEVQDSLKRIAEQNVSYAAKEGAAETGDRVTIDFLGRVDGEEFEGGKAEGADLVLGSNRFIPGFEDQLIGMSAGDARTISLTFPEDYGHAPLAGKAAEFDVTVKDVAAQKETEIDEDLAKMLGLESLESLRDAVRKNLEREYAQQSRARAKRRILDALDGLHDFELPPNMVEQEFGAIWQQVEADIKAGNLDDEDKDKSEDELKAEYRKIAERRVRLGLVLAEIGREGNVRIQDEEVARAVNQEAMRYPGQEREVVEFFQKTPQALAQIRAPLYEEKVVDYILELAEVTDETVSREDLFKDDEAPGAAAKPEGETKPKPKKKAAKKAAKDDAEDEADASEEA